MSVAEMQACVARLYVDTTYRRLFYLDPASALAGYSLMKKEQEALLAIDRERLEIFAGFLMRRRREIFAEAFPAVFRLSTEVIERYCDRYLQLHVPVPGSSPREDVLAFGRFMEQSLTTAEGAPVYAADVVRYERALYASGPLLSLRGFAVVKADATPATAIVQPTLPIGVHIEWFDYDVVKIAAELLARLHPSRVVREECVVAFLARSQDSPSRAFRLSADTAEVLELCEGRLSVRQIASKLERRHGTSGLVGRISELLRRMRALGLVEG